MIDQKQWYRARKGGTPETYFHWQCDRTLTIAQVQERQGFIDLHRQIEVPDSTRVESVPETPKVGVSRWAICARVRKLSALPNASNLHGPDFGGFDVRCLLIIVNERGEE